MHVVAGRAPSLAAYELARRLVYHASAADPPFSPVRSGRARLDALLRAKRLTEAQHRQMSDLLRTVEGCDLDHRFARDELVVELTRRISARAQICPYMDLDELARLI
jgi:hypothetical protein